MLDPKLILENPDLVRENNRKRGRDLDIDAAIKLLEERSSLIGSSEELRAQANDIAERIPKASETEKKGMIEDGRELKEQIKEIEGKLADVKERLEAELRKYPNILQDDVPEGKDEDSNEEMRKVGEPTVFDFEPKDHLEIGEALGIIDVERAAKVSGSRFAYLKGDGVLLHFALIQYALQETAKEGFSPVIPPNLISTKAMGAMGYLEKGGEEEIYHLKNDDQVMIGTSEQALGPMHMDEMLDADQLPIRYVGVSPCYRREAGSYGKDVKGILRLHQFDKVEMFGFVHPDESESEHELILAIQERLMQGLGIPYRVMKLCSGDTGTPSSLTYDIESWVPSQELYRETHSTSNTTDFQARRLNCRYKKGKEKGLVHTLNGTAFAIGRTIIAILENNQQADGSVVVPEVLRPMVGKDVLSAS